MKTVTKIGTGLTFILILVLAGFLYFRFYFVFGEGVKAGELNRIVYKGYVFKTYEGRVIQTGFTSKNLSSVQSNEFVFSVKDKTVADSLMYHCAGKEVEIHYKEYKGALPWRGKEKFVVDRIISVK